MRAIDQSAPWKQNAIDMKGKKLTCYYLKQRSDRNFKLQLEVINLFPPLL